MLSKNAQRLSLRVFALVILLGLFTSFIQPVRGDDPHSCNLDFYGCIQYCSSDPDPETCNTQCEYDHAVCQSGAFGASLSPENFSIPVAATACSPYYTAYTSACMNNHGPGLEKHQAVYDACIEAQYSELACCQNVAEDFAMSLVACQ